RVDRVHGAREHRVAAIETAMADYVRLRARARVRVFIRAAPDTAVRRLAPSDVAAVVQRRRRARSAPRARGADPGAGYPVPYRRCRAPRHNHPVNARCAYRLALDDGPVWRAASVPVRMAGVRCGILG